MSPNLPNPQLVATAAMLWALWRLWRAEAPLMLGALVIVHLATTWRVEWVAEHAPYFYAYQFPVLLLLAMTGIVAWTMRPDKWQDATVILGTAGVGAMAGALFMFWSTYHRIAAEAWFTVNEGVFLVVCSGLLAESKRADGKVLAVGWFFRGLYDLLYVAGIGLAWPFWNGTRTWLPAFIVSAMFIALGLKQEGPPVTKWPSLYSG